MRSHFTISALLWLVLATIALPGCNARKESPNAKLMKAAPPLASVHAVSEADLIGVWKGSKYVSPPESATPQWELDDFPKTTREFKANHTLVTHSWVGENVGTWKIDGSIVIYTLKTIGQNPPLLTKFKMENGNLVEMRGDMKFIYEKLSSPAPNKK